MKSLFRKYVVPRLIYWIYFLHFITWKLTIHECQELKDRISEGKGFLLAHWHGDEIALLHCITKYKLASMVSKSSDGELMAFMVNRLGGYPARGSSSRSGVAALKELIRVCKSGRSTSIAVDGPKGPIYVVKPGVLELSRFTGHPVFPISCTTDRAYHFNKSWNKTYLPKLFARVEIVIGPPMKTVTKSDDLKSNTLPQALAHQINSAKQQALSLIAKS